MPKRNKQTAIMTITPTVIAPGGSVSITGSGFPPNGSVGIAVRDPDGDTYVGGLGWADAGGNVEGKWGTEGQMFSTQEVGVYQVSINCGQVFATGTFTVA